jgi:hypothetical protein
MREPEKVTSEMVLEAAERFGLTIKEARWRLEKLALEHYVQNIGTSGEFNTVDEIKLVLLKLIERG